MAVTDGAVTVAILVGVAGIVMGWLAGRGYQRYWDRREARDRHLDEAVAARYREGTYDELLIDRDELSTRPVRPFYGRPKPVNWEEDDG